jgi:glycosyltransferase involved in cell wall biosynthesis
LKKGGAARNPVVVRFLYLLDQDFPDRQTQTIQVMNMGVELARLGVPTRLLVRRLLIPDRDELFAHFGLEPEPGFSFQGLYLEGRRKLWRKMNRWRGLPFYARLGAILGRQDDSDTVVYSRGRGAIEPARIAAVVGRPMGIRVFYEVHKFYGRTMGEFYRHEAPSKADPERYLAGKLRHLEKIRRREAAMLRTVSGLICINRGIEERVRARFGPGRPVATIPSAARAPDHVPGDDERDLDLVYLGDIGPKKGIDILVDAMARLPGRRLLIHGKGKAETSEVRLRKQIADLGLGDRVEYGGWIRHADVPPLLARARASVIPYRGGWAETTTFVSPLKIYELMLAGVPIVSSDLPSLREVLRHDETGVLVPPDDPEALAAGLRRVLEDREDARRMADAARVVAREYTWRRRAERVLEFVEETG